MRKVIILFLAIGIFSPTLSAAQTSVPFEGKIDFENKRMDFAVFLSDTSRINAQFAQNTDKNFSCTVNVEHLDAPFFDISTILEGSLTVQEDEGGKFFIGRMRSRYTLLNYKPVGEMIAEIDIRKEGMRFVSFSVGNITGSGTVTLRQPPELDIDLKIKEVSLADFINFWAGRPDVAAEGLVSGEMKIGGDVTNLRLGGEFASYGGYVDELNFDNIVIFAEGIYPVVHLFNSSVSTTEGLTFSVDGSLNLAQRDTLDKQILALSQAPLVTSDNTKLEWTFKRIQKEKDAGKTELKYLRKKNDALDRPDREQSGDMLGIERSVKF